MKKTLYLALGAAMLLSAATPASAHMMNPAGMHQPYYQPGQYYPGTTNYYPYGNMYGGMYGNMYNNMYGYPYNTYSNYNYSYQMQYPYYTGGYCPAGYYFASGLCYPNNTVQYLPYTYTGYTTTPYYYYSY